MQKFKEAEVKWELTIISLTSVSETIWKPPLVKA